MLVKDILERVTPLYHDEDYVRVPQRRYLQFLDDALSQLILARPDAHVRVDTVQLQEGTRQELPEDGYVLIDIYMNKPNQTGIGAPILQVERKNLDYFSNWHGDTSTTVVNEYAFDTRSPRVYWVTPPVGDTPVYVEMAYSYKINEFAKIDDTFDNVMDMDIPISDNYRNPIIYYVLNLLYSTDSSSVNDRAIAQRYEQLFYQSLGLEYKASVVNVPMFTDGVSSDG